MSRRHYIAIANAIRERLSFQHSNAFDVAAVARDIARIAKADNPRFDERRFFGACGLDAYGAPGINPPARIEPLSTHATL